MEANNNKICENCGYFRQHYIWSQGFMPINQGHCTHPPRVRQCRPQLTACPKWIPQDEVYRFNYIPA